MALVLSYMIYSGLIMTVMYAIYKVLMSRDTFYGFNRAYLLLSYVVSFAMMPVLSAIGRWSHDIPSDEAGNLAVVATGYFSKGFSLSGWGVASVTWIWAAGVAAVLVTSLVVITRIILLGHRSEKLCRDGVVICVADDRLMEPFTWGGRIFISRKDYGSDCRDIIVHEKTHLVKRHWIDLMIAQAVIALNWFNPTAWLMRRELQRVHEYQADGGVARSGADMRSYQMMLIGKAAGNRFAALVNSFNNIDLSKRIDMMQRHRSQRRSMIKSVMALPLVVFVAATVRVEALAGVLTPYTHDVPPAIEAVTIPENDIPRVSAVQDADIIVNGKSISYSQLQELVSSKIKSITVLKNPDKIIIDYRE